MKLPVRVMSLVQPPKSLPDWLTNPSTGLSPVVVMQVPVLRNLVPAQVLSGRSSFNSGNSLSAGLPIYARNQVKAIAAILDRG